MKKVLKINYRDMGTKAWRTPFGQNYILKFKWNIS